MEFSSHRNFIAPNVSAADCCLGQMCDYRGVTTGCDYRGVGQGSSIAVHGYLKHVHAYVFI